MDRFGVIGLNDTFGIENVALERTDNVGIVFDDLEGAIEFFREFGLELEGRAMVEGEWGGRVSGLAISMSRLQSCPPNLRLLIGGFPIEIEPLFGG